MKRALFLSLLAVATSIAADWPRFRGPNGTGVSTDSKPVPAEWSSTKNVKWKTELPGPGSSSPIVVGDRLLLTCWTGYAAGGDNPGRLEDLKRHLLCFDRNTGKELWNASVPAVMPEDNYRGQFAENGYASHTPVSDGEKVFVFFGKSGVHAYDLEGKPLWQADVGDDLSRMGWGSASSPILYKNLLIVTALVESQTLYALDKETGKVVWKQEAKGFDGMWGTPVLVEVDGRTELVYAVPYEIWGMEPETGKMLWYCEAVNVNYICSSILVDGSVVYAAETGPSGGGSIAVRAGGSGDVTKTHVLWSKRQAGRIGTPVAIDGRLYWVSGGTASCVDAKTGEEVYRARLESSTAATAPSGANRPAGPGGRPGRPGGFGGGRGGGADYSSPVAADGKLFYVRRSGETAVLKLGEKFEQLATNRFDEGGDFSASPAISDGALFIRSSKHLYCIGTP
jgi:outer membrane protein assembly factor BamB